MIPVLVAIAVFSMSLAAFHRLWHRPGEVETPIRTAMRLILSGLGVACFVYACYLILPQHLWGIK